MSVPLERAMEVLEEGVERLRSRAMQWFLERLETTFAMRTGDLRVSYQREFDATSGPPIVRFVIGSNSPYAEFVDHMVGVNWTFPETIEHAAIEAGLDLRRLIGIMIREAFMP